MKMTAAKLQKFQEEVGGFYYYQGRHDLPWRKKITPYKVWISEVMLQQTQVDRVVPKFLVWMKQFPTVQKLAEAPQADILRAWSGLGYNRRALNVQRAAKEIMEKHGGRIPHDKEKLVALPGIGAYTVGAIRAFAWNLPEVFIETNIRRVFLHHFFHGKKNVSDIEIFPLIEKSLRFAPPRPTATPPHQGGDEIQLSPRTWYYALMDYGSHVARTVPNPNRRSRHYAKQSRFQGSLRQLRGKILRAVTEKGKTVSLLIQETEDSEERLEIALAQLQKEGFIEKKKNIFGIKK